MLLMTQLCQLGDGRDVHAFQIWKICDPSAHNFRNAAVSHRGAAFFSCRPVGEHGDAAHGTAVSAWGRV